MKKLLLLSLSAILLSGNIFGHTIFSNEYTIKNVPINIDKLVIANSIISTERKNNFYQQLRHHNLNKEDLLYLINSQYNNSGNVITSINDAHISEILKEQKNILIDKNRNVVMGFDGIYIGDKAAEDYSTFAISGFGLAMLQFVPPFKNNSLAARMFDITGCVIMAASLCKLIKMHIDFRMKEADIEHLDYMIARIEEIEKVETTQ